MKSRIRASENREGASLRMLFDGRFWPYKWTHTSMHRSQFFLFSAIQKCNFGGFISLFTSLRECISIKVNMNTFMASTTLPISFLLPICYIVLATSQYTSAAVPYHFVLVHGFGHGAWCWYKPITLLEEAGHVVTAIDLTSNGNSKVVADTVTSLAEYTKPLTDFLDNNVSSDQLVVLVGHSLGGSSITYAMELFPHKISKAIFVAAAMPSNGDSFPSLLTQISADYFRAGVLVQNFANGPSAPATSAYVNLTQAKHYFYNLSPAQDVNLAYTLLNPTPTAPLQAILKLTPTNYGSIRRFYIRTPEDHIIEPSLQESIINHNPPERVFEVTNSDHSPFFSEPVELVKIFLNVASMQSSPLARSIHEDL